MLCQQQLCNPKLTYTLTLSILSMFCTHTCSKKRFENEESLLFYCLCSMSLQSNLYIWSLLTLVCKCLLCFNIPRDVRRLVVAMSRARLGLYIFGRVSLFQNCYELSPTFRNVRPISITGSLRIILVCMQMNLCRCKWLLHSLRQVKSYQCNLLNSSPDQH